MTLARTSALVAVCLSLAGCSTGSPPPAPAGHASGRAAPTGKADDSVRSLCERLAEAEDLQVIGEAEILTRDNWKSFDVIAGYDYNRCQGLVAQEKLEFEGQTLWRFRTTDDPCDGGNSYGSIYTEDLTTPVAHIYDGDVYCEGWAADLLASNHTCDAGAEIIARRGMSRLGIELSNVVSSVEIRDPYVYSYVHVEGQLPGGNEDDTAVIKVLTQIASCKYGSASITHLPLDIAE